MRRRTLFGGLAILIWIGHSGFPLRAADPPRLEDLVFVTEDRAILAPGCDAMSVFSIDNDGNDVRARALYRGDTHISPGRMTATSDFSLVVATHTNTEPFLYILKNQLEGQPYTRWSRDIVPDREIATLGGIAVLPGDQSFLVATSGRKQSCCAYGLRNLAPFHVRRYPLTLLSRPGGRLDHELGSIELDRPVVEILPTKDGTRAHLVTDSATVYTIDVSSMQLSAPPIQLKPIEGISSPAHETAPHFMHSTMTADEHYLITNRGRVAEINVADLLTRQAWTLPVGRDVTITGGVAINGSWINAGLLALHGRDGVYVYQFRPMGPLVEHGWIRIPPVISEDRWAVDNAGPRLSIAWSGSGEFIIAATEYGAAEFIVIQVKDGGTTLLPVDYLVACSDNVQNGPNDILTANGIAVPSPTATATSTSTPPPTASPTSTPSATSTPPPTATASVTASPPPAATPTATGIPGPIYLPVVLNESCAQQWVHADVALVLDTSTSMNRPTRSGRGKLAATQDAAKAFVGLMDFTPNATGQHDQVAVVGFNDGAWVQSDLTNDPATIRQAIDDLPRRQHEGTRLDLAFTRGAEALSPERRRPGNTPVLVLLTDGLPNRVPTPAGGGSQEDTVLAAAGRAKGGGIRVYTIALGAPEDTKPALLMACATDPSMYHHTPDAEDLGAIYTAIAYAVGCPKERFWGGR
jgi:Mg-chelatase subunit ChlD